MASEEWNSRLPTLEKLGAVLPENLDASRVAEEWFRSFTEHISDAEATLALIHPDALWRDLLAFTWDMRTFVGEEKIRPFVQDRVAPSHLTNFRLTNFVQLQKPFPDLAWIVSIFRFEVDAGECCGVFRLVPTASGVWKAFTIFTCLESLKNFPYKVEGLRRRNVIPGVKWAQQRHEEVQFEGSEPAVLIVGAGQSALSLAARLKYLDVPTLMIEKDARVGDSWRKRYDSLCLHFPVWNDHMPYLPYVLSNLHCMYSQEI
ncbi:flavin-containing monooxygenase [Moniliophthora roreri MCA 2997]|uniref:Flavin-containing monooxygenase n=1 Tax=Moniliophthora roreri (strain MCA 2997) TaxID=1381753 RepID=V2WXK6_MONRO|nr:flavin-containing monooxygenase [Moniliophthora roreri MCA 2997]